MFRMISVWAAVVVAVSVLLLIQTIGAEESEASGSAEFEVVIPKVTLDVKDAPLSTVLAEVKRQTGVSIQTADRELGGKRVTLQVSEAPALQVLAELVEQTGLGIGPAFGEGLLLYGRADEEPVLTTTAGPCLLVSRGSAWSEPGEIWLTADGIVAGEPLPFSVGAPEVTEVLDAAGKNVRQESSERISFGTSGRAMSVDSLAGGVGTFTVSIMEEGFDEKAPFPRTIRGTLKVTYAVKTEEVVINLKADVGVDKKAGDVSITYVGLKKVEMFEGQTMHVLSIKGDASKRSPFVFKDAAGNPVSPTFASGLPSMRKMEFGYQLDGEAATVSCSVATEVVVKTYPFEFKDTPAPKEE